MTLKAIEIEAASRLHFGLLSFGAHDDRRQYGGVGLMVSCPGMRLTVHPADEFRAAGPMSDRLASFAGRWAEFNGMASPPACALQVTKAAPQHVGLGTGTQLGLSVAALLYQYCGRRVPAVTTLAESVGRGLRSSVGTYGFEQGGMVFELGKRPHERVGKLEARQELSADWRVVQWTPRGRRGLSGVAEQQAFGKVQAVPTRVTDHLVSLVRECMLPAARAADVEAFGEAVYQYGIAAGDCFGKEQGGSFASPRLERWVQQLRAHGVAGVGQSSWGPTLFAIVGQAAVGEELGAWLEDQITRDGYHVDTCVSPIANRGAQLRVVNDHD